MITDATVGAFLVGRHPDFAPLHDAHLEAWGTEPSARYLLFQCFSQEFLVPRLRTGTLEERGSLFDTIERLLTDGDTLIEDAVDHEVIDELVYVGYRLKDDPADVTGAGPRTMARIVRTRDWRP